MQKIIKRTLKLIGGIVLLLLLFALSYYFYYTWRQELKYTDKITVTAFYMQYACGDCSVDMKVKTVSNRKYDFIIEHDIFPTPQTKKFFDLCNYISDKSARAITTGDSKAKEFTMTGYLRKNRHGLPFFNCSGAPFFTVEKIKYGVNDQWTDF